MTEQKKSQKAQFKVVGGSIVILPPDDEAPAEEQPAQTALEVSKGAITVKVEGDKDTSQVTDAESEALSNQTAHEVREENAKSASEAQVATKPRKAGNSVVTSGTFNDMDLPEYDKAQKQEEAKAEEKTEKAEEQKAKAEEKAAEAQEDFYESLQDAFAQQSEEFVEVHEDEDE